MATAPATKVQQPLSQSLIALLEEDASQATLTLNRLLERTEGRGLYLVMVFLCLPFVIPVSVPGVSTLMGAGIAVLAMRQALGKPPRLPRVVGERPLPPQLKHRIVSGSAKLVRFLEKLVRPRRTHWLAWPAARFANSVLIALMAVLLALPLPAPPFFFMNTLPSYAIIIVALSVMERDGLTIWLGYAAAVGTFVYVWFWADLIANHLVKWVFMLIELVRSMQ